MDKGLLFERKCLLEADLEQYLAFVNQVKGAIEDCNFWISQIEGADKPAPELPDEKITEVKDG